MPTYDPNDFNYPQSANPDGTTYASGNYIPYANPFGDSGGGAAASGGSGGGPTSADDFRSKFTNYAYNFGNSHPGANPSTRNDPGYWGGQMYNSPGSGGPTNLDTGYWASRMMQPEGPPEGGGRTAGGGGNGALNFSQALQYLGLSPNDPRIGSLYTMFGGTGDPSQASYTTAGLDPVRQYLSQHGGGPNGPVYTSNPDGGRGNGQPGAGGGFGGSNYRYTGTNVFNDPATQPFEDLLNQRIQQLLQNWMPPDSQNTLDFLRNYQTRLTGAPYTDSQMDLIQTQAIDPLTRQRDAARQQAIQWGASHGQDPNSGPVQTMLQNIERDYSQNTTRARSGFATNAIGLDRQNWQQAAGIGPQMMNLEQQIFGQQEGRNNQALSLAQIIPTMAWQRLQGSNNMVQQDNPAGLLSLLQGFQNQGYQQGGDFAGGLMSILPYILQMFGGSGGGSPQVGYM